MCCKGQTKIVERGDIYKLNPCYSKYTLVVEKDEFGFLVFISNLFDIQKE